MNCKLKKGVAVSHRNKLMALKWKDKRDVCMLSSIHDDNMETVCDKKDPNRSPKCSLIIMMQWEELIYQISVL
jgi:hypothetical protein